MSFREVVEEKALGAEGRLSAGRIIAIAFSVVFLIRLVWATVLGMALGWPDAVLGVFCLLSVPIHKWFASPRGFELVQGLISRLGIGGVAANASPEAVKAGIELMRSGLDNRFTDDERGEP